MKVLITGYYGAGNFGDDIMLESFCKEMKKANSNLNISILKMFNKKLKIELDKGINVVNFYKIKRLQALFFKIMVRRYDVFLWVGGTCFTDQDGNGFYDFMKIAKEAGLKIGYVSVGTGKLSIQERIDKTKYLAKNCDFITLRDENSYKYMLKARDNDRNIFLTEDLAYLFVNNVSVKDNKDYNENKSRKIVVSWRNLINYRSEEYENNLINNLIEFLNYIISENIKSEIIILPLDDRRDLEKNKIIYDKLSVHNSDKIKVKYESELTPLEKIKIILSCDINISARLHGIFVSEIRNIKTIGISYSIKIDEFLKSIGKNEDFVQVDNLSVENLKKIYKHEFKTLEEEYINDKINKSKENIKLLNEFLNSL